MKSLSKFVVVVSMALACIVPALAQRAITIQGSGVASAISANQFAGSGSFRIGRVLVEETSVVTLLSLVPGPGDSLVGESTHVFDLGSMGTFTTLDELVLVPINDAGLHKLKIQCTIVGGTGDFTGVSGRLTLMGTANLVTGQVVWRAQGVLK